MPTTDSRGSLTQDLSDLPGMPGHFSANRMFSSQEDAHIPKSVLDIADDEFGFPNLKRMNEHSDSAKLLQTSICFEDDPEREAFHAELERVAARIEQVKQVSP